MDELQEELEHLEFLSECNRLVEKILWKTVTNQISGHDVRDMWDDIAIYGNEPNFTSLIFDKLLQETYPDEFC